MRYIKQMLLPGEEVLYDGHVHPKVLMPGIACFAIAMIILHIGANTGGAHSYLLDFAYWLSQNFASMQTPYRLLWEWQSASPGIALEIKVLAFGVMLCGLSSIIRGTILMQTTELVVTNSRIIAKIGVFAIETIEMDKRRVAEVQVYQSYLGRIMGYGNITIHGFTNSIVGLPQMVNPHLVEQFLQ